MGEPLCTRCNEIFAVRDGHEDTTSLCDPCAQAEVAKLRAALAADGEWRDRFHAEEDLQKLIWRRRCAALKAAVRRVWGRSEEYRGDAIWFEVGEKAQRERKDGLIWTADRLAAALEKVAVYARRLREERDYQAGDATMLGAKLATSEAEVARLTRDRHEARCLTPYAQGYHDALNGPEALAGAAERVTLRRERDDERERAEKAERLCNVIRAETVARWGWDAADAMKAQGGAA